MCVLCQRQEQRMRKKSGMKWGKNLCLRSLLPSEWAMPSTHTNTGIQNRGWKWRRQRPMAQKDAESKGGRKCIVMSRWRKEGPGTRITAGKAWSAYPYAVTLYSLSSSWHHHPLLAVHPLLLSLLSFCPLVHAVSCLRSIPTPLADAQAGQRMEQKDFPCFHESMSWMMS